MDKAAVGFYQKNWWMFLVEGIVAVLFGLFAVANPASTLALIVLYFGLFLVVSGMVNMIAGIMSLGKTSTGWLGIVGGLVELGIGVYLAQRPNVTFAVFVIYAAIALLVRGVLALVEAFETGIDGGLRALRVVGGVAGLLAGVVIWRYPVRSGVAFVWVLGLYALVVGPLMIVLAFKAKDGFAD